MTDSVFACYQTLIRLRKELPVLTDGTYEPLLEEDARIFAYRRDDGKNRLLVVCNFFGEAVPDPLTEEEKGGRLLLSSYAEAGEDSKMLRPYEARMLLF